MKFQNEGTFERTTRIIIGAGLICWGYLESGEYWGSYETPIYQTPCWIWENFIAHACMVERGFLIAFIGIIPLLTGMMGWCPLNSLFRINTHKQ